jgi:hypothetical protein
MVGDTDEFVPSCNPPLLHRTTLIFMANPKHTIHVGIAVTGLVLGGLLSVLLGDPSIVAVFTGGSMSALGYWLGAAAQRRHG